MKGVYKTTKKDGATYYRSSITFRNKHISLGSFDDETEAHEAYLDAYKILFENRYTLLDFKNARAISFEKWVSLCNFRDNGLYIKNPIYLHASYFSYYIDELNEYKFDIDDLFYYSNHKIFKKNGYLFVNDYGMQLNILNRYGIKNFAVEGRDYRFIDNDPFNLTRQNIEVINNYHGVEKKEKHHKTVFTSKININGRYTIGEYSSEEDAAIAYNKAADYIQEHAISQKEYLHNYIASMDKETYLKRYKSVTISEKILDLA